MENRELQYTGGARLNGVNATWPFAKLIVTDKTIEISAFLIGNRKYNCKDVSEIVVYGVIPLLGRGIRIYTSDNHPQEKIVFWSFTDPNILLERIKEVGFKPEGNSKALESDLRSFKPLFIAGALAVGALGILIVIANLVANA